MQRTNCAHGELTIEYVQKNVAGERRVHVPTRHALLEGQVHPGSRRWWRGDRVRVAERRERKRAVASQRQQAQQEQEQEQHSHTPSHRHVFRHGKRKPSAAMRATDCENTSTPESRVAPAPRLSPGCTSLHAFHKHSPRLDEACILVELNGRVDARVVGHKHPAFACDRREWGKRGRDAW